MNYIVFDLEWNQGNDGKEEKENSLPFEIIEIGAVRLNEKRIPVDKFHRIIRPVVYPKLFEVTKRLVALDQKDLENGVPFPEAAEAFLDWCGEDYLFCTWGTLDLVTLQNNMDYFNIPARFPFPLYYADVQLLYGIVFERNQEVRTLAYAVREAQIPRRKEFHGALNDAEYTAKILGKIPAALIRKYPSVDLYRYPAERIPELWLQYPDHALTVFGAFSSKEELRRDRCAVRLVCSICGKKSRKVLPWFSNNAKVYYSLGMCRQHGFLKGKLAIKNPKPGRYLGIQTVRPISAEEGEQMKQRYRARKKKA